MLALNRIGGPQLGLFTQAYLPDWCVLGCPGRSRPSRPHRPASRRRSGRSSSAWPTLFFVAGWTIAGWVVSLLVFALATLAAVGRICVGCIFYERLIAR